MDSEEAVESDEITEEDSDNEEDEEGESLPFAKAEVVRLMKQNLDRDKMIRERVKVLKESIYPYQNIERINEEKKRILMHLHAIKADCDALSMDVKKTLKLKDVHEEDEDPAFMDY
ncbi:MAG: hypothetical protein HY802_04005 [Methanobacterium sp.]|nr:hypothetical protein [Methanobacterium sp.]